MYLVVDWAPQQEGRHAYPSSMPNQQAPRAPQGAAEAARPGRCCVMCGAMRSMSNQATRGMRQKGASVRDCHSQVQAVALQGQLGKHFHSLMLVPQADGFPHGDEQEPTEAALLL